MDGRVAWPIRIRWCYGVALAAWIYVSGDIRRSIRSVGAPPICLLSWVFWRRLSVHPRGVAHLPVGGCRYCRIAGDFHQTPGAVTVLIALDLAGPDYGAWGIAGWGQVQS